MSTSTTIIGIVLLVICIVPVILMNKYGKGNKIDEEK